MMAAEFTMDNITAPLLANNGSTDDELAYNSTRDQVNILLEASKQDNLGYICRLMNSRSCFQLNGFFCHFVHCYKINVLLRNICYSRLVPSCDWA